MSLLNQVFASGGDVIISTLELTCSAWDAPILLCNGYEDQVLTTEDSRTLTFIASGIDVALPQKNSQGGQVLTFAIDNVTGEAQQRIDSALEANAKITLIFRHYLASDPVAPAGPPLRFTVQDGAMEGATVQINAGFFDMINTAWPRKYYTTEFSPGIKYL